MFLFIKISSKFTPKRNKLHLTTMVLLLFKIYSKMFQIAPPIFFQDSLAMA